MELFDEKVLKYIGQKLLSRKETIAVAESVTAGLLQFAVSSIPDAAKFFQGGLTAYNLAQKFKHLRIDPMHAESVNCVSQQVASEMALGLTETFASHWSIGVTGYASPVPESENKLFAFFSIAYKGKIKVSGKIVAKEQEPTLVQLKYVNTILDKLKAALGK